MAPFIEALGNAAKSAFCGILNTQQKWIQALDQGLGGLPPDQYAGYLGAVQRQFCDQGPPDIPSVKEPSGQCPGAQYDIYWEFEQLTGAFPGTWIKLQGNFTNCNNEICGPINGPQRRRSSNNNGDEIYWTYKRCYNNTTGEQNLYFADSVRYRNFSYRYTRCNGQQQSCDSPFPVPAGDWNVVGPINVTYDVGGNTFNINPTFTFNGLKFDVNGNIVANFGVQYFDNDLNIPVDIDLNVPIDLGGFDFDFGGNSDEQPSGDGCSPPKPGEEEPAQPLPPSEDPDQTGEDEPPNLGTPPIRAVVVTVTNLNQNRQVGVIQQDDNPDILIPAAGYVSFQIAVGTTVAWTSDIPVKNIRNFIPCPWEGGAVNVRGTPRQGVTWQLTPIYASFDDD